MSGRNAILAKIHLAKKQLNLDDSTYREVLLRVTGHRSCRDCSPDQLGRAVAEFERLGFADARRKRDATAPNAPLVGKLKALWWALHHLGVTDEPTDERLLAFVARQAGAAPTALRFATAAQLNGAIEGAKQWLRRLGLAPASWDADDVNRALLLQIWKQYAPLGREPHQCARVHELGALNGWISAACFKGRNRSIHALDADDLNKAVGKLASAYRRKRAAMGEAR
jgi:phage gp16-like protein